MELEGRKRQRMETRHTENLFKVLRKPESWKMFFISLHRVIIIYDIKVMHFYSDCSQVLRDPMLYVLAAPLCLLLWPSIWVGFNADRVISNQLVFSKLQIGQASEHSLKLFNRLTKIYIKRPFQPNTSHSIRVYCAWLLDFISAAIQCQFY